MKNLLSLAVVAGFVATTFGIAPAHADEFVSRYTYLVNGVQSAPLATTGAVLTQPAVIGGGCNTLTQSAVVGTPGNAIMVQDHENIVPHFFHLGLWPLVDFSIF